MFCNIVLNFSGLLAYMRTINWFMSKFETRWYHKAAVELPHLTSHLNSQCLQLWLTRRGLYSFNIHVPDCMT